MATTGVPPSPQRGRNTPSTLVDVARLAGVSPSTVSRILNGTAQVADEKRKAVEAAILKLKFRPNLTAQGLRSGSTRTIGVLTQELESPYFAGGTKGVEEGLEGSGYSLMVVTGNWSEQEGLERAHLLIARKVDALVILGGSLTDAQVTELALHLPTAITGRQLRAPSVYSFHCDQVHGGLLATEHLIGLGHRRIAHISGAEHHLDSKERCDGYFLAHQKAGLSVDPRLIVAGDFLEASGERAMHQLLDHATPFTAVFCANDQMLWGARRALYRRGIRVPEDISLVGVDDLPQSAYMTPPITTVRQPIHALGRSAAVAVLQALGAVRQQPIEHPPLELIVRETSAPPLAG
jgi:LacI family transcriptional regulator